MSDCDPDPDPDPDCDFDFHNLLRLPVCPACLPAGRGEACGTVSADGLGVKPSEKTTREAGIGLQQEKFGVRPDLPSA